MENLQRDTLPYDVAIIGAGPAGLAAAIRLRQLNADTRICVIEKAAQIGGHSLAGAVLEPRALDELLPDWRTQSGFAFTPVTSDHFCLLTAKKALRLPTPPQMHNKGNGIIDLAPFVRWLGDVAQSMNIDVLPGFAAQEALLENGKVVGVRTGDFGLDKDGNPADGYTPGPDITAAVTLFAEGCRGHITKSLVEPLKLAENRDPQSYAIGLREVWRVKPENFKNGHVDHLIGWPLDSKTYGGGWIYHHGENLVSLGFVVGLDYQSPNLHPQQMLQAFKTHPKVAALLDGAEIVSAGGRALYEGGIQGQYKLAVEGALFIGDAAGFLNVPKIKGIHTAMKSGMLAAEAVQNHLAQAAPLADYPKLVEKSWLGSELFRVRNIRPGFRKGLWFGLANAAWETLTAGRSPWTLRYKQPDHLYTQKLNGQDSLSFTPDSHTIDRLTATHLAAVAHNEAQPVHLKVENTDICATQCVAEYGNPCTRFCPAGVYEMVGAEDGKLKLQINSANCIHCKTCDIKDPYGIITWVAPEGGSGPNY